MSKKIGVYICSCGGNISDYVDVEKVKAAIETEENVAFSKTAMFACSDASQKEMEKDIQENNLDDVIVASCSPKLHLTTFRAVTVRAGLNKFSYYHANIREQVSWAHSDDKSGATENAIHVVKAAIAKMRHAKPLDPIIIRSKKAVAVIGAGVSGMRAAIGLAKMECEVYLIERNHFIGGHTAQWEELFPSEETGRDIITRLYQELLRYKNIKLYTGARIVENSGHIGNFILKVKIDPLFVHENPDISEVEKAIAVCPVTVPDAFNFNLTERKAIYRNHPGEFPERTVVDVQHCTRCGECIKVCKSIDFSKEETSLELQVGSILFATGFDPYTPGENEFGYGQIPNVITLPQFMRLIALNDKRLIVNGKDIKKIAYIYCVGSRQPDGDLKYCSRYCCTAAIHASIRARKKYQNISNFHFTRGVRTYGKQEVYYNESLRAGDVFLQSFDHELPVVYEKENRTFVKINDILTEQKELVLEADLVVLVTSMVPRTDQSTASLFKLPKGRDNFLKEVHMKLRPVETVIDGITIAGTCQGPMNITESVSSSLSAAVKAYSYVSKGEIELEPIVASINKNICTWCNACYEACPFDAINKVDEISKSYAVINNSICKGCGMCLPVCPYDAIELITYSNREIEEMIDMLSKD
ncbi:MAG: CoB--CoM heterodisulfide reductase iron-sulfur subunit A family protein [Bacteroidales bacterium]|nr:CoB--CoM heterodisulfide reductase iron-sulfur subunit A family protein [Bacteroidales bacterium]